ncbi:GDSL esterase/lipase At1g28600 [Brachypodium distachyon]|uniref:GDSL esterase/lipase n=1 Tax=Brachypodium distachyon TaxID=15368 RepID=A0A2K2DQI2_BRADI|nr:GDSL esterase/lipase At1g28600 [Brachypodium distachyon]PNT76528.1 hypothetical protein BRADI_1g49204v3 [Brachypodium distachyon]|eukprot:XP_010228031.2 GDSL esterase/lipase At1g28600 [Brachypodium distachyon]
MAVVSTSLSSYVALSCCCLMAAATLAAAAASEPRYNAMFNLGDSTSDTGNLCPDGRLLLTGVFGIFARPPYGNTYFGKPTCLCSDGRVNVDFLSQALGLPFLTPSLAHGKDFRQGANMAIVGGTARDYDTSAYTGYDVNLNGSMKNQMEALQRLLPSICGTPQNCKDYLAKSLFVFQLGENDYSLQLINGATVDEASKNMPIIVSTITSGVEKLITLGAVHIVVSNIAPLGCYPMYLFIFQSSNKSDYDENGCLRNYNILFNRHNALLRISLSKLQKKHRRIRIMYADLASHFYHIVLDPRKFGFKTVLTSCCGKADSPNGFDLEALCGMDGASVCHEPWGHLTWDGMHPSDAANERVANGWLNGPYSQPPILK